MLNKIFFANKALFLYFSIFSFSTVSADDLDIITIESAEISTSKPSIERKTHTTIQKELIRDTSDLARYTTDVGIADNGRRLKGFSMRGVEGNRVGISIDGVALPDFEENSLYNRYGNFNNSRLSIDSELVRNIDIVKGADSFNQGSGALGGGVIYRTLNTDDILMQEEKWGGLVRSGYSSKNDEWVYTIGAAYKGEKLDALLLHSQRHGHEMESAGGNITPWADCYSWDSKEECSAKIATDAMYGTRRIHPDPEKHRYKSYLFKIGYQLIPSHKVGINLSAQDKTQYTWEHSYDYSLGGWREVDDYEKRLNLNLYYIYTPENNTYISKIHTAFDHMSAENGSINYKGKRKYGDKSIREPMDKIDNRKMTSTFNRLSITAESQPFQIFKMDNLLTLKAYYSEKEFENINLDKFLYTFDGSHYRIGDVQSTLKYTIQRPVKNKVFSISLQDNLFINDIFSSTFGVKYNHEKMDVRPYRSDTPCSNNCLWAEEKMPPKDTTFVNWNGFFGVDAQLNYNWKVGYNIGTGYRIPTSSEMIFTYRNPAGNWLANPDLKAERSLNHNLFLKGEGTLGYFNLNLHYTNYKDFLFQKESFMSYPIDFIQNGKHYTCGVNYDCGDAGVAYTIAQQMVNLDSAKIYGLEISGKLNLDEVSPLPRGLSAMGSLGYTKGKLSTGDSLLTLQPLKLVLGLDYEDPTGKFGIFTRATYNRGKKAGDAKVTNHFVSFDKGCQKWEDDLWFGRRCILPGDLEEKESYNWLNESYWTVDVFGFYKPIKKLTLRAGIYNLFNKKYHTWDSLRGINRYSTTNTVPPDDRQGLERYYAPGRNYSLSIEYKF
ncbi:hemoglobin/transferrin/lactoferrin receptor protein [Bisgaardia hudsonensis]|uniref:Hemoglobin/transferrin/lactoferrin receptor protein n=1 Tax=Bisgaardia hudsonensis TaxID=109472 RepID=A0A4R2MX43_9PAST|nr:TonB-dependent hemoglobin/transferrin/lactoferrin family receptor [Bisgaardia hudsonensis]TCP12345.1 hemoglobin/transferrin/lactoferrin receptor protein [Bisgaardia hudsonensis]